MASVENHFNSNCILDVYPINSLTVAICCVSHLASMYLQVAPGDSFMSVLQFAMNLVEALITLNVLIILPVKNQNLYVYFKKKLVKN